ncbi:hypothetical protein HD554DRAFT_2091676 [Boletus coccyginus]|nr:hypothetical protein HD554DRAFT_2091676 [Boletus coccyginus]
MAYYGDSNYVHRSHSHSHSHSHQHGPGYLPNPPVGADPQLWQYFSAVDTNRSGVLSTVELQNALVNGNWSSNLIVPCPT